MHQDPNNPNFYLNQQQQQRGFGISGSGQGGGGGGGGARSFNNFNNYNDINQQQQRNQQQQQPKNVNFFTGGIGNGGILSSNNGIRFHEDNKNVLAPRLQQTTGRLADHQVVYGGSTMINQPQPLYLQQRPQQDNINNNNNAVNALGFKASDIERILRSELATTKRCLSESDEMQVNQRRIIDDERRKLAETRFELREVQDQLVKYQVDKDPLFMRIGNLEKVIFDMEQRQSDALHQQEIQQLKQKIQDQKNQNEALLQNQQQLQQQLHQEKNAREESHERHEQSQTKIIAAFKKYDDG